MLILGLVGLRILWRLANPTPEWPGGVAAWERGAGRVSEWLLYALMIALPVTGWIVNSASNVPFRIFWLIPLPAIVAPDKPTADLFELVHGGLFTLFALVLVAHIGAALRHHFVKPNTVPVPMLPPPRRTPQKKRPPSPASGAGGPGRRAPGRPRTGKWIPTAASSSSSPPSRKPRRRACSKSSMRACASTRRSPPGAASMSPSRSRAPT